MNPRRSGDRRQGCQQLLPLMMLAIMMGSGTIGIASFGVFGPTIIAEFGLSNTAFGLLPASIYLAAMVVSRPFGRIVDRVGAPQLIVPLLVTAFLALSVIAITPSSYDWMIFIGTLLAGLSLGMSNPVTNSLVASSWHAKAPGLALGAKQAGGTLMFAYVGFVGPILSALVGWRGAMIALGGLFLLVAPASYAYFPRHSIPRVSPKPQPSSVETPSADAASRPHWVRSLSIFSFTMGSATATAGSFSVVYSVEALAFDPVQAGFLASVWGAFGVVSRIAWVRFAERLPVDNGVLVTIAAVAIGSTALIISGPIIGGWAMWIAAAGIGVSVFGWNAVAMLLVIRLSDSTDVGRVSGIILLPFFLGLTISPVAFGTLTDFFGTYLAGWTMQAIAAVVALVAARRLQRSFRETQGRRAD